MDPERWGKIQQILSLAREGEPGEREALLARLCGDDETLRRELQSLFEDESRAEGFLETPALHVAARQLARDEQQEREQVGVRLNGSTLGHYRIIEPVGAGGMGIVYRAWDEHLQRDVAIKVLPAGSLSDASARKRFRKEALTLAKLNHPNIEGIYDFDTQDDIDFLAMEYLVGTPLNRTLIERRLPEKEIIRLGHQLAEGLAAAQEQGIVHRDLKPSNLLVTSDGRLKILDFGLAKLLSGGPAESTDSGGRCGTLLYMSPEQVNGARVDHRSDIYSAGTVLFEMATGRLPFECNSSAGLIKDILGTPPPAPRLLCPELSTRLEEMILKCLEKDPENRYQSARELLVDFRRLSSPSVPSPATVELHRRSARPMLLIAAAAALLTVAYVTYRAISDSFPPLPDCEPFQVTRAPGWQGEPVLSPEGNLIAYSSNEQGSRDIYVTDLHGNSPQRLTDSAGDEYQPSWYPDASAIAFTSWHDSLYEIWKVNLPGGGETRILSDAMYPAISPDGRKVAFVRRASPEGPYRIGVSSLDNPEECTILTDDTGGPDNHFDPVWSPDGKQICYASRHGLRIVPASGGPSRRLTPDGEYEVEAAWHHDGGRLYFTSYRGSTVAVWRMGLRRGRYQRVTTGIAFERHPSISRDGKRLVYASEMAAHRLVLLDTQSGKLTPIPGRDQDIMASLAPDGTKLVFASDRSSQHTNVWIQDVVNGIPSGNARRLTDNPDTASHPVLSPDGRWIAYYRISGEQRDLWMMPSTGGSQIRFTDNPGADMQPAWSPDGSELAFVSETGIGPPASLWVAPVRDGRQYGKARQLTTGTLDVLGPAWSPDGRTLAFTALTDGSTDIWLVAADGRSAPRKITERGYARWVRWDSHTGEILASASWGGVRIVLWRVSATNGARKLFAPEVDFGSTYALGTFDVTRDARFLVYTHSEDASGHIWTIEAKNGVF